MRTYVLYMHSLRALCVCEAELVKTTKAGMRVRLRFITNAIRVGETHFDYFTHASAEGFQTNS